MFSLCSVEEWAKTFGDELYFMARNMTKVNEIKDVSISNIKSIITNLPNSSNSLFQCTEIQAIQYTSGSKR